MKKSAAFMVLAAAMGLASCGPSTPKANLQNEIDSLSYAIGVTNTQGLMDYAIGRLGVDSIYKSDFVKGIQEGTEKVSNQKKANMVGLQIGQRLSGEMFEAFNNQLFANDSLNKLNKEKFVGGFLEGLQGKATATAESATDYTRTATETIMKDSVKVALGAKLDTISYMMGLSHTNGLIGYVQSSLGVDSTCISDFIGGVKEGTKSSNKNQKARLAGFQIGQQISGDMLNAINQQLFAGDSTMSLSRNNFYAGFFDGIANKNIMSMEDANTYVRTKAEAIQKAAVESKYAEYKKENEDFLVANKSKEGIQTTESGLQYRIIKAGKGALPTKESKVTVHYKGTLIDGTQFDSSYDRNEPTTFGVNQVIAGWTEALTLMPAGSKWELYIPQELAYGSRDMGTIKPFSTLIFEVELLKIEK